MKAQQFVDSLNIIASTFEMEATKLLTRNKPISQKIQIMTMHLLSLKTSVLKCFSKIFTTKTNEGLVEEISQKMKEEISENQDKLKKYELHTLLKRKIHKIHQESMMNSISVDVHEHSFEEDPILSKLRNSLVLIEKDLGINEEVDNYHSGVNSIIQKSMASLDNTPIRSNKFQNNSMISDISLDISIPQHNGQENEDKNKIQHLMRKDEKKQSKEKPPMPKNLPKKKKKSVYSSKEKVLGNLLEQTYQSCLQNIEQS